MKIELITRKEAMDILGIPSTTFARLKTAGHIPYYESKNRADRYNKADIIKFRDGGMEYKKA